MSQSAEFEELALWFEGQLVEFQFTDFGDDIEVLRRSAILRRFGTSAEIEAELKAIGDVARADEASTRKPEAKAELTTELQNFAHERLHVLKRVYAAEDWLAADGWKYNPLTRHVTPLGKKTEHIRSVIGRLYQKVAKSHLEEWGGKYRNTQDVRDEIHAILADVVSGEHIDPAPRGPLSQGIDYEITKLKQRQRR